MSEIFNNLNSIFLSSSFFRLAILIILAPFVWKIMQKISTGKSNWSSKRISIFIAVILAGYLIPLINQGEKWYSTIDFIIGGSLFFSLMLIGDLRIDS